MPGVVRPFTGSIVGSRLEVDLVGAGAVVLVKVDLGLDKSTTGVRSA